MPLVASRIRQLAAPALAGFSLLLGCSQLYGFKHASPSGVCSTNADCAPDELCVASTCSPLAVGGSAGGAGTSGSNGTAGAGTSGSNGTAGAGTSGSNGTAGTGTAGAGTAGAGTSGSSGSAGSAGTPSCGDTAVGDVAACNELPDGTPINFPGGSPQGPCASGNKLCKNDGTFGPCQGAIAPGKTDCSTASDPNCNGKPDNSECGACTIGATQYCYDGPANSKGVGTCKQGTQVCELDASGTSAVWGACAGEVTPALSDTCDSGNDATCNNVPNEGCACINGASGNCGQKLGVSGNCAAGTTKCVSGSWGACSITGKSNDSCDPGDDASCNGKPNEGCTCLNGQTMGCGATGTGCTEGTSTCSGGAWGLCAGNACGDFAVATPTDTCYVAGPKGEDAETICTTPYICSSGYYVSSCSLYVKAGSGSCDFQNADQADPTGADVAATKDLNASSVTCGYSGCTCRRSGF